MQNRHSRTHPIALQAGAAALALGLTAGESWAQQCDPVQGSKLLAADGEPNQFFGFGVTAYDGFAAVGAPENREGAAQMVGAVYVYRESGGVWSQTVKLLPIDGNQIRQLGKSVAMWGDTLVAGAPFDSDTVGAAYVYGFDGVGWTHQAKLVAQGSVQGSFAGMAVDLRDDTIVVGEPSDNADDLGKIRVFDRVGGDWIEQATVEPSIDDPDSRFGRALSLGDGLLVVGASRASDFQGLADCGSVWVFRLDGGVWVEEAMLLADDRAESDYLGTAVAVAGNTIVAGATRAGNTGAAYVFEFDGASWSQSAKLVASDASPGMAFGCSVRLEGDTILVGAAGEYNSDAGAAYVFRRDGSGWIEDAKITASDGAVSDQFGHYVAMHQNTAIIAALGDDDMGGYSGSAYAFSLNCSGGCPADINGDGAVDTQDFLAFLNLWAAGDSGADWDGNGTVNTVDFLAYLNAWAAGCL